MPLQRARLTHWLFLALVLRSAFALYHAHVGWDLRFDPGYYLTLAQNLEQGVYSLFHPLDIPDTTRMPGYPFLVFLLGGSIPAVLELQVLLSTAKVLLVHRLGLITGLAPRTALLAGALMALEPVDIILTGSLLTETCFTTALLAGIVLLVGHKDRRAGLAYAALCFGVAAWLRANGAVLAVWSMMVMVVVCRWSLRKAVIMVAALLVTVAPWIIRNQLATGRAVLSDSGPVAAAYFHLPEVLATAQAPAAATYRQGLHDRASRIDWEDRGQASAFFNGLRTDLRRAAISHPIAWCKVQLRDAAGIYLAPGRGHIVGFFGHSSLSAILQGFAILFSTLLVVALFVWGVRARHLPTPLLVILLIASGIILTGGISTTDARFKAPAMPLLLIGAAWAVEELRRLTAGWSAVRLPAAPR
jgi:hypothetical protein